MDPYRLYHYGTPAADLPPPHPTRVRWFLYACAAQARRENIEDIAMAFGGGH